MNNQTRTTNRPSSEFQAVILAGGAGHRLYPLTSKTSCKHLLPISNQPLLGYQLQMLEKSGFNEVIVITMDYMYSEIMRYATEVYKGSIRTKIIQLDTYMGSADALRYISNEIVTDFFVLSGDVISNVFLHYLADIHRSKNASMTMLLQEKIRDKLQNKADDKINRCYIGIDHNKSNQIILYKSLLDVEEEKNIYFNKEILRNHTNIYMS